MMHCVEKIGGKKKNKIKTTEKRLQRTKKTKKTTMHTQQHIETQ
jgi:hypothetical protein